MIDIGRKNKQMETSAMLNNQAYNHYLHLLTEIGLNMFEWSGLPPSVDPRFLEICLFNDGYCLYFDDEVMGNLALQCMIGGQLDVYNNPIERTAYATNGYQNRKDNTNSVIIYNNYTHTNTAWGVNYFVRKLYELDRAIDVNIKGQRTPVLVKASEKQRLTMMNLYMQYDGNQPFIFGDKNLDMDAMKVLRTDVPFISPDLQEMKQKIFNEALMFLGITSSNTDKRERLVTDEVLLNLGDVSAMRRCRLNSRQDACERINRLFGTDIWVEYAETDFYNNVSHETSLGGGNDGSQND